MTPPSVRGLPSTARTVVTEAVEQHLAELYQKELMSLELPKLQQPDRTKSCRFPLAESEHFVWQRRIVSFSVKAHNFPAHRLSTF